MTKINMDGIEPEDRLLASKMLSALKNDNRLFGNPAEGLRQTLSRLEKEQNSKEVSPLDWVVKDSELTEQIAKTKAGIKGEVDLCDYIKKLIEDNEKLDGMVVFASLSYDLGKSEELGYTPDTDILLVYGKNILIIDAKNIKTKPGQLLVFIEGGLYDADKMKLIIEFHPSTHIWKKVMEDHNIPLESIDGYVVIVNDVETSIVKNEDWYSCHCKPIHAADLRGILEKWVEGKDSTLSLKMLTEISKAIIEKEKATGVDKDQMLRDLKM